MSALAGLAAALRAEGGLIAAAVRDPRGDAAAPYGALAARGPLAVGREAEIALVVEAVREGYLLHYGDGARVVATDDPDLALLAGDRLYALGLARLAAADDLESVDELTDVIGLCAQAHAADDAALAEAVWEAGAVAIGWGADASLGVAKIAARNGDPAAAAGLRAAARQIVAPIA